MHLEKLTLRDVSLVTRHPVACQWAQREQSSHLRGCRVCGDEESPEHSGTWPVGLCRVDQGPGLYVQGQMMESPRTVRWGQALSKCQPFIQLQSRGRSHRSARKTDRQIPTVFTKCSLQTKCYKLTSF